MSDEVSRDEAMHVLLASDDKYTDVTLQGSDGGLVPAVRCLLAARSSVMDKMLYGNFAEASNSTIKIPYPTEVLQGLVGYIYADSTPLLENHAELRKQDGFGWKIAALADAAKYFELSKLSQKALGVLESFGKTSTEAAIQVLNACGAFVSLSYTSTAQSVMRKVIKNYRVLLNEQVLASILPNTIKIILENQNIMVSEQTLFTILLAWSLAKGTDDFDQKDRKSQAKEFVNLIDLSKINPKSLEKTVSPSGLVTESQLLAAYRTQAHFAADKRGVSFGIPRGPVWKTSGGDTCSGQLGGVPTHLLDCPPLCTGVHKWKLKVLKSSGIIETCIGVISSDSESNASRYWIGNESVHGWAYSENGCLLGYGQSDARARMYHFDRYSTVRGFRRKSIVTLTLDLTGKGTLSASVDDCPSFQLFSGMLSRTRGSENDGFIPAVSLKSPAKIRFLGFE